MPSKQVPVVKRSLFSWVFDGTLKLQVSLFFIIIVTVAVRLVPLEMQKRIINQAIHLSKTDLLFFYSGLYIAAVTASSLLKYGVNILETIISQRATAKMRSALFAHIITLPLTFFRNTPPGLVVNALVSELTIPGNFVGTAFSTPLINIMTLIAFAAYLIWLNPILGLVSLSIYPAVIFLVPILQKKANRANKERVDLSRQLAGRITESALGIHEIQANAAFEIENSKIGRIIENLRKIRIKWTLYREGVKQLNNYFVGIGPFLVFLLGGWLVIKGRLELGALVAFLSAQEKLYAPWKELLNFYQVYQDGIVNYRRTMNYFDTPPAQPLMPVDRKPYTLKPEVEIKGLRMETENRIRLIDNIDLTVGKGEHLAVVGFSGSGKSTLALCIGQLAGYSGGSIFLGEKSLKELSKMDMACNMGFVSQTPFIFSGTIEENLLYASEAVRYCTSYPQRDDLIAVLQQTGLFVDVLKFGLDTVLDPKKDQDLVETIIRVRENFRVNHGEDLSDLIEFFDENSYMQLLSAAENIIFGSPAKEEFFLENLHENRDFTEFLRRLELRVPLIRLGALLVSQTISILGEIKPDALFFEQSPIRMEELEDYKSLHRRIAGKKLHGLGEEDKKMLLKIGLRFTPARHKMVRMPEMLETMITEARSLFKEETKARFPDAIVFYDSLRYIDSQSILNNIFFGRAKSSKSKAQEKISQKMIQLLIEEDILERVIEIGLQYQVGNKGENLSGGQRQKLAIARVLLKEPGLIILDEATSALDSRSQERIQNLMKTRFKGRNTVIAVVHRLDILGDYDRIAVMKAGKLVEIGTYDELISRKGFLHELVYGRKP